MDRAAQMGTGAAAADRGGGGPQRPVGIVAAFLAVAIVVGGLLGGQAYAVRLAGRYLQTMSALQLPIKWESLTFQRAALASDHWLPMYGSSELYCCGPLRAPELFATQPTGFRLFGVGRAGTTDLYFLQTFGALGGALHGKKLVISDSPQWYFDRGGVAEKTYAGNFSPEIAEAFVFTAPLSLSLRQAAAKRMLAYPQTLQGQPILRLALVNLADGSPLRLAAYDALLPVGRLDVFVKEMQDAYQTVKYIHDHAELRPDPPASPHPLDWSLLLSAGTGMARDGAGPGPFGFPTDVYDRLRTQQQYGAAARLYCSGRDNRNGQVITFPASWADTMRHSAGWTDLQLELEAVHELGADALVFSIPMPGLWYDEIGIPVNVRQDYYERYMAVAKRGHATALDMRTNDEDRFFLHDTGAHFSPRGWVFADRAIDLFWHDSTQGDIHASLAAMNRQSPPVGLPDPKGSAFCVGQGM